MMPDEQSSVGNRKADDQALVGRYLHEVSLTLRTVTPVSHSVSSFHGLRRDRGGTGSAPGSADMFEFFSDMKGGASASDGNMAGGAPKVGARPPAGGVQKPGDKSADPGKAEMAM